MSERGRQAARVGQKSHWAQLTRLRRGLEDPAATMGDLTGIYDALWVLYQELAAEQPEVWAQDASFRCAWAELRRDLDAAGDRQRGDR